MTEYTLRDCQTAHFVHCTTLRHDDSRTPDATALQLHPITRTDISQTEQGTHGRDSRTIYSLQRCNYYALGIGDRRTHARQLTLALQRTAHQGGTCIHPDSHQVRSASLRCSFRLLMDRVDSADSDSLIACHFCPLPLSLCCLRWRAVLQRGKSLLSDGHRRGCRSITQLVYDQTNPTRRQD